MSLHRAPLLRILTIALLLLAGCSQSELYDLAQNGVPLIYATTDSDDGLTTLLIVASGNGYYRELSTTVPPSGDPLYFSAQDPHNVFISISATGTIYHSDNIVNGVWQSYTLPSTVYGIASRNGETFALTSNAADCVYRYNDDDNTWTSMGRVAPNSAPYKISYSQSDDRIYILEGFMGGNIAIWDYDTMTQAIPTFSIGPGTLLDFLVVDGIFYTVKSTTLYENDDYVAYNGTDTLKSVAIAGPTAIFFGGVSGSNLGIYRVQDASINQVYAFSSTNGNIVMEALDEDTLAVGIFGSDAGDDGLYLYHIEENRLQRLSSRPVFLLTVR